MTDEVVEGYVLRARIGQGAMGAVYEAHHRASGKRAAIKILSVELSRFPGAVGRFKVEARAASSIEHPGVVDIFSFNVLPDGRPYLVMELLEGETLAAYLARARPADPVAAAAKVGGDIASVLVAAHGRGVIHRDLKPQNVFIAREGDGKTGEVTLKVLDFGLAKLINKETSTVLTQPGGLLGTPAYMSPEQCRGRSDVDGRSDVYSLGCLLFEIVSGNPPFVKEALGDFIIAHATETPPTLTALGHEVPPTFDALVTRMLAKSPRQRPGDIAAIKTELDRFVTAPGAPLARVLYEGSIEGARTQRRSKATTVVMNRGDETVDIRSGAPAIARATTLTRAAVEIHEDAAPTERVPRRRNLGRPIAFAAVALLVAGATAAAGHLYRGQRGVPLDVPKAPAALAQKDPPKLPATVVSAAPARERVARREDLPGLAEVRVAPPETRIELASTPPDSDVWVRGDPTAHCRTPCTLSLTPGQAPVTLVARREGYLDRAKTVVPDRDQKLGFHLERQRAAKTASASVAPAPPAHPVEPPPVEEDPARL